MEEHGLIFVNPRFKRKASTLDEAVEQCMFRVRDIIDPKAPADGCVCCHPPQPPPLPRTPE